MSSYPSSSSTDSDKQFSRDGDKFVTASQGSLPSIPSEYTTTREEFVPYKTVS
ncbi:hypothetical protein FB446DRAFT_792980 [Lentinula raphanica]|nr:hypothetical protein FB446DRAFT_792980 [Lentinula raphanica]